MVVEQLTSLGWGIITLGVLIGLGIVLLATMGGNLAACKTGYQYQTNGSATYTTGLCCETASNNCTAGSGGINPSVASQNLHVMEGYLGTSSGGLASWIPLLIILVIGMFFLGAFMVKKGRRA
jgi:hypothetical protein